MSHATGHRIAHSPSPFPLPPVGHRPSIGNWRRARTGTARPTHHRLGWMAAPRQIGGA